jgi:hypothetical protein
MRFYTQQHRYYCGIDLHARRMYVCTLDSNGEILVHRKCWAARHRLYAESFPLARQRVADLDQVPVRVAEVDR